MLAVAVVLVDPPIVAVVDLAVPDRDIFHFDISVVDVAVIIVATVLRALPTIADRPIVTVVDLAAVQCDVFESDVSDINSHVRDPFIRFASDGRAHMRPVRITTPSRLLSPTRTDGCGGLKNDTAFFKRGPDSALLAQRFQAVKKTGRGWEHPPIHLVNLVNSCSVFSAAFSSLVCVLRVLSGQVFGRAGSVCHR
jgi:hypothetical protein